MKKLKVIKIHQHAPSEEMLGLLKEITDKVAQGRINCLFMTAGYVNGDTGSGWVIDVGAKPLTLLGAVEEAKIRYAIKELSQ